MFPVWIELFRKHPVSPPVGLCALESAPVPRRSPGLPACKWKQWKKWWCIVVLWRPYSSYPCLIRVFTSGNSQSIGMSLAEWWKIPLLCKDCTGMTVRSASRISDPSHMHTRGAPLSSQAVVILRQKPEDITVKAYTERLARTVTGTKSKADSEKVIKSIAMTIDNDIMSDQSYQHYRNPLSWLYVYWLASISDRTAYWTANVM